MRTSIAAGLLWGVTASLAALPAARAAENDTGTVSRKEYNATVKKLQQAVTWMNWADRKLKKLDAAASVSPGARSGEEAVDLNAPGGATASSTQSLGPPHHTSSGAAPNFKVFFDFNVVSQPGIRDFTFDNFHSLLLFEMIPTPDLQFSFEINPTPRYYELDYQLTPTVQLRAGKIWIPFDDMSPHNIFGGRVNVSKLALGAAFLPDLWTDLGVGVKIQLIDTAALALVAHAYVVNGFRSGGTDPKNPAAPATDYPLFSDLPTAADNNRDKAFGGRVAATFLRGLAFGASFYSGRWSDQGSASERVNMLGVDGQFRVADLELRSGLARMSVAVPNDSIGRGGFYGEAGYKLGANRQWKAMVRGGTVQLDDRVIDVTDQQIVGGTLLWHPGLVEYSIEHSRDVKIVAGKKNYEYTALRMVIAL